MRCRHYSYLLLVSSSLVSTRRKTKPATTSEANVVRAEQALVVPLLGSSLTEQTSR